VVVHVEKYFITVREAQDEEPNLRMYKMCVINSINHSA